MINLFKGENEYLSNFYACRVQYNGRVFKNSESAYQAAKFDYPVSDLTCGKLILRFMETDGGTAKKLARENKIYVRPDWTDVSLGIMTEIVHAKFTQNKDLRIKLVLTYPQELVEGNYWKDFFWGVCDGRGKNWLGRILMAERVFWLDLMANKYKGQSNGTAVAA